MSHAILCITHSSQAHPHHSTEFLHPWHLNNIVYQVDGLWEREGRVRAMGQQPWENTPREMKGL